MNLKRHHVLYMLLAVCLILAIIVFLIPVSPQMSYTAPSASSTATSTWSAERATSSSQKIASNGTVSSVAPMRYEVVTTQAAQERGLGGRSVIPENFAMLFVFPQDARIGFWMKDMLMPIDMIWVSDKGTILGIEDSVAPDTYPKAFYPPQPVKYVLEIKAGEARRRGWNVGTKIELPLPYRS